MGREGTKREVGSWGPVDDGGCKVNKGEGEGRKNWTILTKKEHPQKTLLKRGRTQAASNGGDRWQVLGGVSRKKWVSRAEMAQSPRMKSDRLSMDQVTRGGNIKGGVLKCAAESVFMCLPTGPY